MGAETVKPLGCHMSLCECTENHLPGHQGGPVCTTFLETHGLTQLSDSCFNTMGWSKFAFSI